MIDWDHVNGLRDDVGEDDFDEVVDLFLEEVDEIMKRLPHKQDCTDLEADLHALKGCAQGLGFRAFARLCQAGESQCKDGKADSVQVPAIIRCYSDSRRIFLDELPTALVS